MIPTPGSDPALDRIWAALPEARLVGGAVRDRLAGLTVADLDLATPEPPQQAAAALRARGIKVVETGLAHGTVTAVIDGRPFEITTLREDVDTDGRHARVAWTADWRADAARRDFTINAMSLSRNGALHDFFGGAADLAAGRVRFVGDPARRIAEDGLRILRFFRFQARYGRGDPDPAAIAAIASGLDRLAPLSAERVWSELKRLLSGAAPAAILRLMRATGVLHRVLPGGADPERVAALDRQGAPADPILRLAALCGGLETEAVAARLRLSNAETGRLRALSGAAPSAAGGGGADDDALRRRLADAPADVAIGRSFLAGEPALVRDRLATLPRPVFPLAGRDAVGAGIAPGPAVGRLLADVRAWWLAGGCRAGRDACLDRLRALASGL